MHDLRFKFIDAMNVLELVMLSAVLTDYDFKQHIACDIGIDEKYGTLYHPPS